MSAIIRQTFSHESLLNILIIQYICSFDNPATAKEHWLQIYFPLSHFDPLIMHLKTSSLLYLI
jgi:hypothetical protein